MLLFLIELPRIIDLTTIAIRFPLLFAIVFKNKSVKMQILLFVAIVGRAITILEAIQKRSHEPTM